MHKMKFGLKFQKVWPCPSLQKIQAAPPSTPAHVFQERQNSKSQPPVA